MAKTSMTPNQITTARLVTGLSAAGLMAVDAPMWQYTACGIFILSLLLHSLVDFNLRVPGNAALFVVLLAMALAQRSMLGRSRRQGRAG